MGDIKTSIILDLAGNLQSRAQQFTGGLQRLGKQGSASMRLLGSGVSAASRGLDRLGNRYTAFLTGAAGIGAVRQVGNLEERFVQLGIQAGKTAEEIAVLKKKVYEVAKAPEIRVNPDQLISAVEKIVEKTGDLDLAMENLHTIGATISASGSAGEDIGAMIADLQEKFSIRGKTGFLEMLDTLVLQGKAGAYTLQYMSKEAPKTTAAYAALGRTGSQAGAEMGALLQMSMKGTGEAAQAATAFERLMSELVSESDKLKKNGIQLWDPEQLKLGKKIARSVPDVIKEIMRASKGDPEKLGKIFGQESIRALTAIQVEFQQTGDFATLDKFLKIQGNGKQLMADSAEKALTFNAALRSLSATWQQFADNQLSGPVKNLTEALDGLKPGTVERWLNIGKYIALIGGGLILANKVGRGIAGAYKLGKGLMGKGAGGALAGSAGGSIAPIPVYVVNKHLSMMPGKDGSFGAGAGGAVGKNGSKIMGVLGKAGALTGAGALGYELGGYLNQGFGALFGGKHKGEGWLGEKLYDAIHGAAAKPVEVNGTIEVAVTDDRIKVKGIRSNKSGLDIDVNSGLTMVGP